MNLCLFIVFLFLISVKTEYIDVLKQLYLTRLTTFFDVFTMRQCTQSEATTCFLNAYKNDSCFEEAKIAFNESEWNVVAELEYTKPFQRIFQKCISEKVKEFSHLEKATPVALPIRNNLNMEEPHRIEFNQTFKLKHRLCLKQKVEQCLRSFNCLLKLEFNAIPGTMFECRNKAMKNFGVALDSEDTVVIASSSDTVEDIDDLSQKMVGPLTDQYASKLPQNIVDTFGNLTFEQLNAIKEVTVIQPYTQHYLCYFPKTFTVEKLQKNKIYHQFSKISAIPDLFFPGLFIKTKTEFRNLKEEQLKAVKEVIKVHPHFRWFLCSSIFAVTTPKNFTNMSDINFGKIEKLIS